MALGLLVSGLPAEGQDSGHSGLYHQDHPESSPILAVYDFEQPEPSGPDTFWVRQREGGAVALSDAFRVSGERSLHISEVPGNRDFAEFLAYFRQRDEGSVFIPRVDLTGVPGFNGHADSSVKYFSLIGDLEDAGRFDFFVAEAYERLRDDAASDVRLLLELSDVAHLRGDVTVERGLRESIYGRLEVED